MQMRIQYVDFETHDQPMDEYFAQETPEGPMYVENKTPETRDGSWKSCCLSKLCCTLLLPYTLCQQSKGPLETLFPYFCVLLMMSSAKAFEPVYIPTTLFCPKAPNLFLPNDQKGKTRIQTPDLTKMPAKVVFGYVSTNVILKHSSFG